LGKKLLKLLEIIHIAGYTYNDLKLDNILFGMKDKIKLDYCSQNCFENCSINLVDFGFASPYIDTESNKHI